MNFGMKKVSLIFALTAIFGSLQVIVTMDNSDAQTAQEILNEVNGLYDEANDLINYTLQEEQKHISSLSCQQLLSKLTDYKKAGDYWASQVNIPHYASRAEGYYASAERRRTAYLKNCL